MSDEEREDEMEENKDEDEEEAPPEIDWKKVGKVYEPGTEVETVVAREMNRMKKLMEKKIIQSDIEMEEKMVTLKNPKKK